MRYLTLFLFSLILATSSTAQSPFTPDEMLKVVRSSVQDMTADGQLIALTTSTRRDRLGIDHFQFADPTYVQQRTSQLHVINTASGDLHTVTPDPSVIQEMAWSPDNRTLAVVMMDDQRVALYLYDSQRKRLRELKPKSDLEIASNTGITWTPDGSALVLSMRPEGWRERADSAYTAINDGPIVIQDSRNDFLAWERVWLLSDEAVLAHVDVKSREVTELTEPGSYGDLHIPEDGSFLAVKQAFPLKTDYTRSGTSEYVVFTIDLNDPSKVDTLISRTDDDPSLNWDHTGKTWAWSEKGKVFIRNIADTSASEVTADHYEFVEEADTTELKFRFRRWSADDTSLLLQSDEGYHVVRPADSSIALVYAAPEDEDDAPQLNLQHWSDDERYLYFSSSARNTWERGLVRWDVESQQMETLMVDDHLYSGWRFADDEDVLVFSRAEGNRPYEVYTSDQDLSSLRQLTNLNDWLEDHTLSETELLQYMDADGDTLYGVLYYPTNYEEGKRYPLIAYIYENFFDNSFNDLANVLTNRGYFVLRPSVDLEEGYPGEGWVKGVTSAINKLMERGLVDGNKLGVEGISYGGYGANLLITQTDRFAAAINNSGKVNMISFLGDSPKITTRNYAAAEVGQDRIGQTFWEAPDKYIAHSAVFFADRIKTPLLILSGEGDWNVPADNQREMYYALRRLGKPVKWVNYMKAGHGAGLAGTEEDFYHQWETVFEWYEEHFGNSK